MDGKINLYCCCIGWLSIINWLKKLMLFSTIDTRDVGKKNYCNTKINETKKEINDHDHDMIDIILLKNLIS